MKARQFKLACHPPTLPLIPICVPLQGTGSWKWSRTEIILGGNEAESKKTKRRVFFSTKSLPCTTQCRGHFTAWEWYPCQSGQWLLKWKVLMLQTLVCFKLLSEWLQCPSSTHTKAVALRLGLLKPTGAKKILQAVGELTGSPPCPRNSTTTLTTTCNHLITLRQAEKGTYTVYKCDRVCKLQVLYQSTWQSPGISSLCKPALQLKKTESRMQLCFPPTPSYSSGLMLAQMLLGRVAKQIGKPIKLRTSLGFWHHMDVTTCEKTTLPM